MTEDHYECIAGTARAGSHAGRRRFLKSIAASSVVIPGVSAVAQVARPIRRQPRGATWQIQASRVVQSFMDGSSAPFFRLQSLGSTPVAGTMPVLSARANTIVSLRINNTLTRAIRPKIVGGAMGPWINPGDDVTFDIAVPRAGTWLLTDDALGVAAGPMGLGAVIIARSVSAGATPILRSQPAKPYREYVLAYTDSDDRWNNTIDAGGVPDLGLYEPNYHTLNNLTFPNTIADPSTRITCRVGERVILRFANFGWVRQSVHFHGYHVYITRMNNMRQTHLGQKDTIGIPGHTTMEVELPVNQPGLYPVHPHSLTTVTDNGLYAAGQITLIDAT